MPSHIKSTLCIFLLVLTVKIGYAEESAPSPWAESTVSQLKSMTVIDSDFFTNYQTKITRSEFAYLSVTLCETLTDKRIQESSVPFSDTDDSFVLKARSAHLITGYPDNSFRPTAPIQRDEFAVILHHLLDASSLQYIQAQPLTNKDRASIPYWAEESVSIAYANHLLSGIGNNTFDPNANVTREQALVLFYNVMKQFKPSLLPNPEYLPDHLVLTPGEHLPWEVQFSWQTSSEVTQSTLELREGTQVEMGTEKVSRYNGDYQSMTTHLAGHTHLFSRFHAQVTNLKPSTTYSYRVGQGNNWTEIYTFTTPSINKPWTFGFFGDVQGYTQAQYMNFRTTYEIAAANKRDFDAVLFAGDLVDTSTRFEEWQFLNKAMDGYFQTGIFAAAIGNHDNYDQGTVFKATFNNPDNGIKGLENRNYWFDVENATIAVWDTESPKRFNDQKTWLKNVMAASDKPFRIILMHRSVYPMLYNEVYIRNLASAFEEAGIDLVLSGHDHIYNRTSMLGDQKVPIGQGVVYICGGSPSGSKYYNDDKSPHRYWRDVVYDANNPVYGVIQINVNTLGFEAYAIEEGTPLLIDTFEITKN